MPNAHVASFTQIPTDARRIVPFRKLTDSALDSLNRDIGTSLTPVAFRILREHFRTVEQRDPTIGEVRLFDILCVQSARAATPVGSLETPSALLAEVWADAMAHRTALDAGDASPVSLTDVLALPGRWIARTEGASHTHTPTYRSNRADRTAAPESVTPLRLLTDPAGRASHTAVLEKLTPIARLHAPGMPDRLLCGAPTDAIGTSVPSGTPGGTPGFRPALDSDRILYIAGGDPSSLASLLGASDPSPLIVGAVLLDGRPLLSVLPALCPGAALRAESLLPAPAEGITDADTAYPAPISALCRIGVPPSPSGIDCLLRVPADRVRALSAKLDQLRLRARIIGKASLTGCLTVTLGRCELIAVRMSLLTAYRMQSPCAFRPPVQILPQAPSVIRTPLFALPCTGTQAPTPGGETVFPVASADASVCTVRGTGLKVSAASTELTAPAEAYVRAENTVLAALSGLCAAGLDRRFMSLSVTLSLKDDRPGDTALAAVCGLYRAAAELYLPMPEPALTVSDTSDRLSVCAYAADPAGTIGTRPSPSPSPADVRPLQRAGRKLYLCVPAPVPETDGTTDTEPTDWSEVRALLYRLSALPAGTSCLLPLMDDGRTPLDCLTARAASSPVGVSVNPAHLPLLQTRVRFGFLVEADPDTTVGGFEIGQTVAASGVHIAGSEHVSDVPHAPSVPTETASGAPKKTVEAPAGIPVLIPILRRPTAPDSLPFDRTLAASLSAGGYAPCSVFPVQVDTLPVTARTPAHDGYGVLFNPANPPRLLNAASAVRLADRIRHAGLTVLTGDDRLAELLLRDPTVRHALGLDAAPEAPVARPTLLIIGSACLSAAKQGVLPAALLETEAVPTAGLTVPVSGRAVHMTAAPCLRYCRTDLLMPKGVEKLSAVTAASTLTYTVGDRVIPDGFIGCGGRVIGFLNGIPENVL